MKRILLTYLFFFFVPVAFSQVTYIGIINHNVGSGSNNLFNNHVAVGQQCYIDWEVYADGMTNMEACGFRSVSRLILRRTGDNDTTSVVASAPIIVPAICAGKNGNNDHYYVDLAAYIDKPGRYSVEIQADQPNMTYPFENASTKTTCNYSCPSAYYLTGTSGLTGNYYTPSGNCASGTGLSDPVGGQGVDALNEISPALHFFTVGEFGSYRQMVVFNGNFYDITKGKFQPGNPTLPASLNGTNGIPAHGICAMQLAPPLSIGGEVNTFKRTDCTHVDVTFASLYYRVYKSGTIPSATAGIALNFSDDCAFNPNGPEGNTFPGGGSCQNANGVLDQRWQNAVGENNILLPIYDVRDTGTWNIEFFTQISALNCAGTMFTQVGDTGITTFTVINSLLPGSPCNVTPVILSSFTVTPSANTNLLNWKVEEALHVKNFEVQRSFDGYTFSTIALVGYINNRDVYNYTDVAHDGRTVFYRIIINETDGQQLHSIIVKVNSKPGAVKMIVQPSSQKLVVQLEHFNKGKYHVSIINTAGALLGQNVVLVPANGNISISFALKNGLSKAVFYAVARDENGSIISKNSFYY